MKPIFLIFVALLQVKTQNLHQVTKMNSRYSTTSFLPVFSKSKNFVRAVETTESTAMTTVTAGNTVFSKQENLMQINNNKTSFGHNVKQKNESKLSNLDEFIQLVPEINITAINISTQSVLDDICYQFSSCEHSETSESFRFCNCDEHCEDYGDCCLNYSTNQSRYIQGQFECIQERNDKEKFLGFFAISVCAADYDNKSVIYKCYQNNILERGLPVVHNKVIYKNKYCAMCNNVLDFITFGIQFNNMKLFGEDFDKLNNLTTTDKIEFYFIRGKYQLLPPLDTELRRCVTNLIENDLPLCQEYLNPIFILISGEIYKNYFCVPFNTRYKTMACFGDYMYNLVDKGIDDIYSLSVIFSFRNQESDEIPTHQCEKWTDKMAENNICSYLETFKNYTLKLDFFLISDTNLQMEEIYRIVIISVWSFQIPNLTMIGQDGIELVMAYNNTIIKFTIMVKIIKRSFFHEISLIEKALLDRKLSFVIRHYNTGKTILIQGEKTIPLNFGDVKFSPKEVILPMNGIPSLFSIYDIYSLNQTIDTLCDATILEILLMSNDTVHINSVTCPGVSMRSTSKISVLSFMTYLTFSISVFALICLIVFNRRKKFTNTIAGSNLENLSLSLLFANLLFMMGIGASTFVRVCYTIGIILHYLWLNVFSYMTIAVLFIVTKIVQMKSRSVQQNASIERRKKLITVIGFVIPILFVGPAVLVDNFGPPNLSPGYDGSVCFPNRYPGNVIFFSGPVALSLAINSVCIIRIITQICSVRIEMHHNMHESAPYTDALIYLRIVILSGIFWMTGIMASILESEWLDYVFIILCGLQGFCIAVANLTTKRLQCCCRVPGSQEVSNSTRDENFHSLRKFE